MAINGREQRPGAEENLIRVAVSGRDTARFSEECRPDAAYWKSFEATGAADYGILYHHRGEATMKPEL